VVEGFPLSCGGPIYSTPALLNLDDDPQIEIAVGCNDWLLYLWSPPYPYNSENIPWGMFHQNELRSGLYPSSLYPPPLLVPGRQLLSEAYNYPNPARGGSTTIRYYLGWAAQVKIKIFNIAGDLVAELPATGNPYENEVEWNLVNIAGGIYFCQLEVKSSGEREVKVIKIAVVK